MSSEYAIEAERLEKSCGDVRAFASALRSEIGLAGQPIATARHRKATNR